MLNIQKELRSGKTISEICDPMGIAHKEQDGKVILTYDMIESFKFRDHPIVKECRGLILYTDNWDIACYPFERFFNMGEGYADKLPEDLEGCLVLEKLDGSLLSLWWDRVKSTWSVSTRKMMYAEGNVNDLTDKTFAQLFTEAMQKTNIENLIRLQLLDRGVTYCFELTSPLNRIVTRYESLNITLLTARDHQTLHEFPRIALSELSKYLEVSLVKAIPMSNWEEILKMDVDPMFEGYVIIKEQLGGSHLRVKVKNPSYLAISKITSSHSKRAFMELIQGNKQDDFLGYFPEYTDTITGLVAGLIKVDETVRKDWNELMGIENQKEFALEAVKRKFPSILFHLKKNFVCLYGLRDYMVGLKTDSLLEMVEKMSK